MLAGEIEQQLEDLRAEVAGLRAELRQSWDLVLAYLEGQRQAARQEQARLDRAIVGLKGEDSSPENPCRKGPSVV